MRSSSLLGPDVDMNRSSWGRVAQAIIGLIRLVRWKLGVDRKEVHLCHAAMPTVGKAARSPCQLRMWIGSRMPLSSATLRNRSSMNGETVVGAGLVTRAIHQWHSLSAAHLPAHSGRIVAPGLRDSACAPVGGESIVNRMVNYSPRRWNRTFAALADPTRRRLLEHLVQSDRWVTELARPHTICLTNL